jgi:hypothetical protein
MTGLGVERTPRTAYPLPSVPPTGAHTLMPPHIQGAERRTERRAGRTGSRWSLRVLVVGGLAGAAWLLTGAAAQAADRTDGPSGSLLGAVVGGGVTAPVTGLLQAATQPLETVRPAHHRHQVVTDVFELPHRVLTRPATVLDEVTHGHIGTSVDAAVGDVDRVLGEVTGPLRLTGGPTGLQQRLTTVTTSVIDAAPPAAHQRSRHPVAVEQPRDPAVTPVHAAVTPAPAVPVSPVSSTASPALAVAQPAKAPAVAQRAKAPAVAQRANVPVRHRKAAVRAGHRHRAAHAAITEPEKFVAATPGGDGPAAPLRLHVWDVSGTPAGGPGTPTEGGSATFRPAAITSGTAAYRLLPIATEVEVRRHDAEAPTVSPD